MAKPSEILATEYNELARLAALRFMCENRADAALGAGEIYFLSCTLRKSMTSIRSTPTYYRVVFFGLLSFARALLTGYLHLHKTNPPEDISARMLLAALSEHAQLQLSEDVSSPESTVPANPAPAHHDIVDIHLVPEEVVLDEIPVLDSEEIAAHLGRLGEGDLAGLESVDCHVGLEIEVETEPPEGGKDGDQQLIEDVEVSETGPQQPPGDPHPEPESESPAAPTAATLGLEHLGSAEVEAREAQVPACPATPAAMPATAASAAAAEPAEELDLGD
jgi:hypothetical protein